MRVYVDGYWAEVVARSPDVGAEWYMATTWAQGASEALRWLHGRALWLAEVLDPDALADGPPAVFREWVADTDFRAEQLGVLLSGHPISANARAPDHLQGHGRDVEVHYCLSARAITRPVASGASVWKRVR